MKNENDNEREKLLLYSLKDEVQSGQQKINQLQQTVENIGDLNMNTENLENGIDGLNATNTNINSTIGDLDTNINSTIGDLNTTNSTIKSTLDDKLQALTVAVRGIGADFTLVDASASDVKSGKTFFDDQGILQTGTIPTFAGETTITQNGTVETGGKFVESDLTVAVPRPQLNPPTISLSGDILTITNPNTNGNFAVSFDIFANDELICSTQNSTVDLSEHLEDVGSYSITASCTAEYFEDSNPSQSVNYVVEEKTIITNVSQISALLNDYVNEENFNTSTEEKLQFGTLLGNSPCAKIWFRQKPTNLTNEQIFMQFFISNLTNPTAIPALIKLNGTTVFTGNLTLASGQDYLATCTINITSGFVPFNELTVEFTDTTQATAYLDYVNISISGTQNCIVLNRDTSFEMIGIRTADGVTKTEFARKYIAGGYDYWIGGNDQDFTITLQTKNFDSRIINYYNIRYAMRSIYYVYSPTDTTYRHVSNNSDYCYITQTNNLMLLFEGNFETSTIATNVCYVKKIVAGGCTNYINLFAGLYFDFEPFIISYDTFTQFQTSPPKGTIWKLQINNNDLPKEFVDIIPVQDYYIRSRSLRNYSAGYFLIHKSGNILFVPDQSSTYCILIGKGKQVNAYLQENGLEIHVYYNINNNVYEKVLTRTNISSNDWSLLNSQQTYTNLKEIKEQTTSSLTINYNDQINDITK